MNTTEITTTDAIAANFRPDGDFSFVAANRYNGRREEWTFVLAAGNVCRAHQYDLFAAGGGTVIADPNQ